MIADPTPVILTAHVAHWADDRPARTAWLIECLQRHNTGDWGDLDAGLAKRRNALFHRGGRSDAIVLADDNKRRWVA